MKYEQPLTTAFEPGTCFSLEKLPRRRDAQTTVNGSVVAEAPTRLHFSLFDYEFMSPVRSGGGGIGISFDGAMSKTIASKTQEATLNLDCADPAAQHMTRLFMYLINDSGGGISVTTAPNSHASHLGLGSSISGNIATLSALNALYRQPFTTSELFTIATSNYVETAGPNLVSRGFDTGVGAAAMLYGGYVLVDNSCTSHISIPTDSTDLYAVVLTPDRANLALTRYRELGIGTHGETASHELITNEEFGAVHQRAFGEALRTYVTRTLSPAFAQCDLKELHGQLWDLNLYGTFKRMQMSYQADVLLTFESLARSCGAIYAGISSAGPSLFAIASDKRAAEALLTKLRSRFADLWVHEAIGRVGHTVRCKFI